jgi:2-furoate---CoA ligase
MNLGQAFAATAARRPSAVALVEGDTRRTYAQWLGDIQRAAGGLAALGLHAGDHVVFALKNRYELATLYWACHWLGLIYTPLNWRSTAAEIAYCLGDAEARAVALEGASESAVRGALAIAGMEHLPTIAVADAKGEATTTFAALLAAPPIPTPAALDEHAICMMLYTSGTTGRPKGVPRSHVNERTAAVSHIAHNRYEFGEVSLGVMPLYHTMGVRVLLSSALLNGVIVCLPAYDAERALELIARERVSAMFLVPTLYHDLIEHPRRGAYDLGSLDKLGYAGMTMTDALSQACMAAFRPRIWVNYYGSSEIYSFSFCDHLDRKPGCAGRAGLNSALRIVRADPGAGVSPDERVPDGDPGEVIASLASPEAFRGYWKRPDANARALRAGWYFTGDLGRFDADGELYLLGRVDDMIISGGENIHPEEVENVLARSPLVRRVAVAGLPEARLGAKVVAFVEPAGPEASADALEAFCTQSSLARFKRPRAYVFVERIPQSPVGKVLRRELRAGNYRRLEEFVGTLDDSHH